MCPVSAAASVAPTREAAAHSGDTRVRPQAAAVGAARRRAACPPRQSTAPTRAAATDTDPYAQRRGLEKALDRMEAAWDGLAFRVLDWKDTGTHVLGGVDDVQARGRPQLSPILISLLCPAPCCRSGAALRERGRAKPQACYGRGRALSAEQPRMQASCCMLLMRWAPPAGAPGRPGRQGGQHVRVAAARAAGGQGHGLGGHAGRAAGRASRLCCTSDVDLSAVALSESRPPSLFKPQRCEVLAHAAGPAGRMGGLPEHLAVPGARVRVARHPQADA